MTYGGAMKTGQPACSFRGARASERAFWNLLRNGNLGVSSCGILPHDGQPLPARRTRHGENGCLDICPHHLEKSLQQCKAKIFFSFLNNVAVTVFLYAHKVTGVPLENSLFPPHLNVLFLRVSRHSKMLFSNVILVTFLLSHSTYRQRLRKQRYWVTWQFLRGDMTTSQSRLIDVFGGVTCY